MKTNIRIPAFFLLLALAACSDNQYMTIGQTPQAAQKMIKQYFPTAKIAYVKIDRDWFSKDYEVAFANGDKVIFDGKGQWEKIKCLQGTMPAAIIPQPITAYVNLNHKGTKILSIEREKKHYEVKLNNRLELKFDQKFNIVDIDD